MSAAASGRLDEQGISQAVSLEFGLRDCFNRASAPGHHRHLCPLGQHFGGYFVAEQPHRRGVWTYKYDLHTATEVGKIGVLSHEAPARPNRLSPHALQCLLQALIVHVAALKLARGWIHQLCGPKKYCLIGFTDKQGTAVGLRE